MPDEMSQVHRRLDGLERNHTDLAKTITEFAGELQELKKPLDELKTDRAVRKERDKNLNERLDRIEDSIQGVYNLGKWVLTAIAATLLTALITFIINGGLSVGH